MSMKSRKPIPLEEHRAIAKSLDSAEDALFDVLSHSHRFYAYENKRLVKALRALAYITSRMDSELFRDYPDLTLEEGSLVYYGRFPEGGALDEFDAAGHHRR